MKLILSTLIFILSAFISNAQYIFGEATYSIKLAEDWSSFDGKLVFNNSTSLFTWKQNSDYKWEIKELKNNHYTQQVVYTDSIGHLVYNDLSVNKLYVRSFCKEKEDYQYEDIFKIKWKLGEKRKKINGLECREASAKFRGRYYDVWYTTEIPVSVGPWKFSGLPGLILQIEDSRKEVLVKMTSLNLNTGKQKKKINLKITSPSISMSNFYICLDKAWKKNIEKTAAKFAQLQAKSPNLEIKITKKPKRRPATELEFE